MWEPRPFASACGHRRDVPARGIVRSLASLEPCGRSSCAGRRLRDIGCATATCVLLESRVLRWTPSTIRANQRLARRGTLAMPLGSAFGFTTTISTQFALPDGYSLSSFSASVPPEETISAGALARATSTCCEHARGAGGGRGHADSHAAGWPTCSTPRGNTIHQLLDLQRGRLRRILTAPDGTLRLDHTARRRSDPPLARTRLLLLKRYASRIEASCCTAGHAIEREAGAGPAALRRRPPAAAGGEHAFHGAAASHAAAANDGERSRRQTVDAGEHV